FSLQTQGVGPTPGHSRLETIMSCRKIILPVLGGWLLSGAAFAQSQVTLQTADIQAFDAQRAKLSAASAMGYAELYTLGDVLDVRFEVRNGRPDYLIHVLKDDRIITVTVDASMGLDTTPLTLNQKPEPSLAEERAAAAA